MVLRPAVVEHLDLDPDIGCVPFERRADADAVVRVFGQLDVEAEDEISILFLGVQVSAVLLRGEEDAVLDLITFARSILGTAGTPAIDPAGQILAIEQLRESSLLRLRNAGDGQEPEASHQNRDDLTHEAPPTQSMYAVMISRV